jgi:hypothetical protein
MTRLVLIACTGLAVAAGTAPAPADRPPGLTRLESWAVVGKFPEAGDVSGVAVRGDLMLLISDETAQVEVLRKTADGGYEVGVPVVLGEKQSEMDLEALALDGDTVYVVGSHGKVRPKLKPRETHAQSREKLTQVEHRPAYDRLVRFKLDADGKATSVERATLRPAIEADPTLKAFAGIPGKENGVDVEALAARGGKLFVGFRGPVLRGNYVPVMVTEFGSPTGELRFVNLGGRGVRDLAPVNGGFLILAGPVGDGPGSFQVYFWNGNDCLPKAEPGGACALLAEVPSSGGEKAEGMFVLTEDATSYEVLLVCDGIRNGNPTRYRLNKYRP